MRFVCLALVVSSFACGSSGNVEVSAYGEDFVEAGIDALSDGWSIQFERFEINVSGVEFADQTFSDLGATELTVPSDGLGHSIAEVAVDTGDYPTPAYALRDIRIIGEAMRDSESKRFDWSFPEETRYRDCETPLVVDGAAPARFEITAHADHLFYDSLVSESPDLRFDALADSDLDGDGWIAPDELAARDVGAYDVGNTGVDDLWSFLREQVRTLGHANGEAHCRPE
ncbi:MAG: hypothetical protein AAFQ82_13205 [Myxococcota bacterium]